MYGKKYFQNLIFGNQLCEFSIESINVSFKILIVNQLLIGVTLIGNLITENPR